MTISVPITTPRIKVKTMGIVRRVKDGRKQVLGGIGSDSVKGETFYRLIGGSVEFGETVEQALRREFKEEMNCDISFGALLGWSENIYTYMGEPGHEIVALYDVELKDAALYDKNELPILDTKDVASWADIEDIKAGRVRLYPHGVEKYL